MSVKPIKTIYFPNGMSFSVVVNDLLYEPVDCIVNPANGGLSHGGGVAAAISQAAGSALDDECEKIIQDHGRIPVGHAVVTTAGNLSYKGVIHAVGPRLGEGDEENKLVQALCQACMRAAENGWSSLSFPAVSSGIFAVPHDVCARAYVRAPSEYYKRFPDTSLKTVRVCLYNGPLVDMVLREMSKVEEP